MKVEIWSDIVCPFCYIGKRQFEKALEQFGDNDKVEVKWRSFQLDPTTKHEPGKSIHEVLAEKKGWTVDKAKQIANSITRSAKELGLEYNFDIAVHGNTFHAHRLTKLAAKFELQNEMEERLFKAYFNEGKNIEDIAILFEIGKEVGIPEQDLKEMLETDNYSEAVIQDRKEAVELGIQGVPFFVFDQKYAVSGAQPATLFTEVLKTAWKEYNRLETAQQANLNAESCTVSGNC
jgi:predicted DsbA family dithiol-disulfide isomerase